MKLESLSLHEWIICCLFSWIYQTSKVNTHWTNNLVPSSCYSLLKTSPTYDSICIAWSKTSILCREPGPCICEEIIKTYRSIKTYHFPFFDDNEQPTSILTWVLSIHSKITLIPYSCSPYHYSSSLVQFPFNVTIVHLRSHFWHHWKGMKVNICGLHAKHSRIMAMGYTEHIEVSIKASILNRAQ